MRLTLPYPPSANRYWRVYQGIARPSQEALDYKALVAWRAREQGIEPLEGPLCVSVEVYRPQKSGDLDNRLKVTLDALGHGVAYHDDKQVRELHAYLHDDKANPRVDIEIQEIEA